MIRAQRLCTYNMYDSDCYRRKAVHARVCIQLSPLVSSPCLPPKAYPSCCDYGWISQPDELSI